MSLLSTYTEKNRVIDAALSVRYFRRLVAGQWTEVTGAGETTYYRAYEYVRTATKAFRYVGLTESAADECAGKLADLFTRTTKISEWDGSSGVFKTTDAGNLLVADVVARHEAGEMWSVEVSVNETDSRMSLYGHLDPASLFAAEDARAYDLS